MQGCILSTMLFNLYLNEIPFLIDQGDTDPIVLPIRSHLSCLLYADDLVLIPQSAEGLENALSNLAEYCEHWLLSVNQKKTKIRNFEKKYTKSTLYLNKHCFHITGRNIEIVNNYSYLGINFSSNRNFKVCKSNLKDKVILLRYSSLSRLKIPRDITNKLFSWIHFFYPFSYMVQRYGESVTKMISDISPTVKKILCKQSLGVNKQYARPKKSKVGAPVAINYRENKRHA